MNKQGLYFRSLFSKLLIFLCFFTLLVPKQTHAASNATVRTFMDFEEYEIKEKFDLSLSYNFFDAHISATTEDVESSPVVLSGNSGITITEGVRCAPYEVQLGNARAVPYFLLTSELTDPTITIDYGDGSIETFSGANLTHTEIDGDHYYEIESQKHTYVLGVPGETKCVYNFQFYITDPVYTDLGEHSLSKQWILVDRPDDHNGEIQIFSEDGVIDDDGILYFNLCIGSEKTIVNPFTDNSNWNGQAEYDYIDGTGVTEDYGEVLEEDRGVLKFNNTVRNTYWKYGFIKNELGAVQLIDDGVPNNTPFGEVEQTYPDGINPNLPGGGNWHAPRADEILIPETGIDHIGKLYSVELFYENECAGSSPSDIAYIRMVDAPLPIIDAPYTFCEKDVLAQVIPLSLTDHFTNADYVWEKVSTEIALLGLGKSASVTLPVPIPFDDNGEYQFTVKVTGYGGYSSEDDDCSNSDIRTFTVYQTPVAEFSIDTNNPCPESAVTLEYVWSNILPLEKGVSKISINWGDGESSGDIKWDGIQDTYSASHVYYGDQTNYLALDRTITLTASSENCSNSEEKNISVNPVPAPDFFEKLSGNNLLASAGSVMPLCLPSGENTFVVFESSSKGQDLNYYWSLSETNQDKVKIISGEDSKEVNVEFLTPGTYELTLDVWTAGISILGKSVDCEKESISMTIEVEEAVAVFDILTSSPACSDDSWEKEVVIDFSSSLPSNASEFHIVWGDGLTTTYGGDSGNKIPSNKRASHTYDISSASDPSKPESWKNEIHDYFISVQVTTPTAGCSYTSEEQLFQIKPYPTIGIDYSVGTCFPQDDIVFSSLATGYNKSWKWTVIDPNGEDVTPVDNKDETVSIDFSQHGDYEITLNLATDCGNLTETVIVPIQKPVIDLSNSTTNVCVVYIDAASPSDVTIDISGSSPIVEGVKVVIDWNNNKNVDLNEEFVYTSSNLNTLSFTNTFQYTGDGIETETIEIPVSLYTTNEAGTYDCSDTETLKVILTPGPVASINSFHDACTNEQVKFSSVSTGNSITQQSWYVNGELKKIGDSFSTEFSTAGTYEIKLVVTSDQCGTSEDIETILIGQTPTVEFGLTHKECKTVTFESAVLNVESENLFSWYFDNANEPGEDWYLFHEDKDVSDSDYSFDYTFDDPEAGDVNPIDYNLRLSVANKVNANLTCTQTWNYASSQRIYANPIASLVGPSVVCSEEDVTYTSTSKVHSSLDATNYIWKIKQKSASDWTTIETNSTTVSPGAYLLNNSGTNISYELQLVVETYLSSDLDRRLCVDSESIEITVQSTPELSNDEDTDISLCPSSSITLDPGSNTPGVGHNWSLEDPNGVKETDSGATFTFNAPGLPIVGDGIYTLTYTGKNSDGNCDASRVYTITVSDVFIADPIPNPLVGCVGSTFTFVPNVTGGTLPYTHTLVQTEGDNVTVDNEAADDPALISYSFTPSSSGVYKFMYSVSDATSGTPCDGTQEYVVKIYESPIATVASAQSASVPYASGTPVIVCGDQVQLIGSHNNGDLTNNDTQGFMKGSWTCTNQPDGADPVSFTVGVETVTVDFDELNDANYGLYTFTWTLENGDGINTGCTSEATVDVHFYKPIEVTDLYPSDTPKFVCEDPTAASTVVEISPEVFFGSGNYEYDWTITTSDGSTTPAGTPEWDVSENVYSFTTNYIGELIVKLDVTDASPGICEASQVYYLTILESPEPSATATPGTHVQELSGEHSSENPSYIVCGTGVELIGVWETPSTTANQSMNGVWTVQSLPSGADDPTIVNSGNDLSILLNADNASNFGDSYVFRWTVSNIEDGNTVSCSEYTDVTVVFYKGIEVTFPNFIDTNSENEFNAEYLCESFDGLLSSTSIHLNPTVSGGSGIDNDLRTDYDYLWTVVDENGDVVNGTWGNSDSDNSSAVPTFTAKDFGTYVFTVTINDRSQGICSYTESHTVVVLESPDPVVVADVSSDIVDDAPELEVFDFIVCGPTVDLIASNNGTDVSIDGNSGMKGEWSVIKPAGSDDISVPTSLNPTFSFANKEENYGDYTFRWTVTNVSPGATKVCENSTEIIVRFFPPIVVDLSDASESRVCEGFVTFASSTYSSTEIELTPSIEGGSDYGYGYTWTAEYSTDGVDYSSIDSSIGSFGTVSTDGVVTFTALTHGSFRFSLEVIDASPGLCSSLSDPFIVTIDEQATAEAWATIEKDTKDVGLCGLEHTIAHNIIDESKFNGEWSIVDPPLDVVLTVVDDASSGETKVSVSEYGEYKLKWTVSNIDLASICSPVSSTITVDFREPIEIEDLLYSTCFEGNTIQLLPSVSNGFADDYAYSWSAVTVPTGITLEKAEEALTSTAGDGLTSEHPYFSSNNLTPGKYVYQLEVSNPSSYSGCTSSAEIEVYVLEQATSQSEIFTDIPTVNSVVLDIAGDENDYVTCSRTFQLKGIAGTTKGDYGSLSVEWRSDRKIDNAFFVSDVSEPTVVIPDNVSLPITYVFTFTTTTGTDVEHGDQDITGCAVASTVSITVNDPISIEFNQDPVFLCSSDIDAYNVGYDVSGGSGKYVDYHWSITSLSNSNTWQVNGEELKFLPSTYDGAGDYTISLSLNDEKGTVCSAENSFALRVLETPDAAIVAPYNPNEGIYDASNPYSQCNFTIDLSATDPSIEGNSGEWSLVSGIGSVESWGLGNKYSTTSATVNMPGKYTFRWTVTNEESYTDKDLKSQSKSCPDFEEITVEFFEQPQITSLIASDINYTSEANTGYYCIAQNEGSPIRYGYFQLKTSSSYTDIEWSVVSTPSATSTVEFTYPKAIDSDNPLLSEKFQVQVLVSDYGTYEFKATLTNGPNGCGTEQIINAEFHEIPVVDFTLPENGCSPLEMEFEPTFTGNEKEDVNTYTFEWIDDSGLLDESGQIPETYFYTNISDEDFTREISLTVMNGGCAANPETVTKSIVVSAQPDADFRIQSDGSCSPVTAVFENKSDYGDRFEWDYDADGTIDTKVTISADGKYEYDTNLDGIPDYVSETAEHEHVFENTNTVNQGFTPVLYAYQTTNGIECSSSYSTDIIVKPTPEYDLAISTNQDPDVIFEGTGADEVCSGTNLKFRLLDPVTGGEGAGYSKIIFTYSYDYDGDGTAEVLEKTVMNKNYMTESFSNEGSTARIMTVSAVAWAGSCSYEMPAQTVKILPGLKADLSYTYTGDCSPVITFTNESAVGASSYDIDFGDGTSGSFTNATSTLKHTYALNEGSVQEEYLATLTVDNGICDVVTEILVIVYPIMDSQFEIEDEYICSSEEIVAHSTTSNAKEWTWTIIDVTDNDNPIEVNYIAEGLDNSKSSFAFQVENTTSADKVYSIQLEAKSIFPSQEDAEPCFDLSDVSYVHVAPKIRSTLFVSDGTKEYNSDEASYMDICSDDVTSLEFGAIYDGSGQLEHTLYALYLSKNGEMKRVSTEVSDPSLLTLDDPYGVMLTDADGNEILDENNNPITTPEQYFRNNSNQTKNHEIQLLVSNINAGCEEIASMNVYVAPELRVSVAPVTTFVCNGEEILIEGNVESISTPYRWEWEVSDANGNPLVLTSTVLDGTTSPSLVSYRGVLTRQDLEIGLTNHQATVQYVRVKLTAYSSNTGGCASETIETIVKVAPNLGPVLTLTESNYEYNNIVSSNPLDSQLEGCAEFDYTTPENEDCISFPVDISGDLTTEEDGVVLSYEYEYKTIDETGLSKTVVVPLDPESDLFEYPFFNCSHEVSQTYTVRMTATYNNDETVYESESNSCSESVTLDVIVFAQPLALFEAEDANGSSLLFHSSANNTICYGEEVIFDAKNLSEGDIDEYIWEYKEASDSDNNWIQFESNKSESNPSYVFENTTSAEIEYDIRLTVESRDGCEAESPELRIKVAPYIQPQFTINGEDGTTVTSAAPTVDDPNPDNEELTVCAPYLVNITTELSDVPDDCDVFVLIDGVKLGLVDPLGNILVENYEFRNTTYDTQLHEVQYQILHRNSGCEKIATIEVNVEPEVIVGLVPLQTFVCNGGEAIIESSVTSESSVKSSVWTLTDSEGNLLDVTPIDNTNVTSKVSYEGNLTRSNLDVYLTNHTDEVQYVTAKYVGVNNKGCYSDAVEETIKVSPSITPVLTLRESDYHNNSQNTLDPQTLEGCASTEPLTNDDCVSFGVDIEGKISDELQGQDVEIVYDYIKIGNGKEDDSDPIVLDSSTDLEEFLFENCSYEEIQTYEVRMTVSYTNSESGYVSDSPICSETVSLEVDVMPKPLALFEAEDDLGNSFMWYTKNTVCHGGEVDFDARDMAEGDIDEYEWEYLEVKVDGAEWTKFSSSDTIGIPKPYTSSSKSNLTFVNESKKEKEIKIRLSVENSDGCEDVSPEMSIFVAPQLVPAFTAEYNGNTYSADLDNDGYVDGCSPMTLSVSHDMGSEQIDGTIMTLIVSNESGVISDNTYSDFDSSFLEDVVFDNKTDDELEFTIEFVLTYSDSKCSQNAFMDVVVYPEIHATIQKEVDFACNGEEVLLEAQTSGSKVNDYLWTIVNRSDADLPKEQKMTIDGSTDDSMYNPDIINPNNSYGWIDVQLTVENKMGCSYTTPEIVRVRVAPTINPVISIEADGTTYVSSELSSSEFTTCSPFVGNIVGTNFPQSTDGIDEIEVAYEVSIDNGESLVIQDSELAGYIFENTSYSSDRLYTITQIVTYTDLASTSTCISEREVEIVVSPIIKAAFTYAAFSGQDGENCAPFAAELFNDSQGLISETEWTFIDLDKKDEYGYEPAVRATSDTDYTFQNDGDAPKDYAIKLKVTSRDGCVDSTEQIITVNPLPKISLTVEEYDACTNPVEVTISNNSTVADRYLWDFGDQTEIQEINTPQVVYEYVLDHNNNFEKVYEIYVEAINEWGCTANNSNDKPEVTIYPEIKADFLLYDHAGNDMDGNYTCYGESVFVNDLSLGRVESYAYVIYDSEGKEVLTSTKSDPIFYTSDLPVSDVTETYSLVLVINNQYDCFDDETVSFEVGPKVDPIMELYNDDNGEPLPEGGCTPFNVRFDIKKSTIPTGAIAKLDFGNGETYVMSDNETQYVYSYTNTLQEYRSYNAKLIIELADGSCIEETETQRVRVYPNVVSDFEISILDACTPSTVLFVNKSTGAKSVSWDFGNGETSNAIAPDPVQYENNTETDITYTIVLQVENAEGCTNEISKEIVVAPKLVPGLAVDITEDCSPFVVTISNNVENAPGSVVLDFGDGSDPVDISDVTTITHTYDNEKSYAVLFDLKLTADNGKGCSQDSTITITANPRLSAGFEVTEQYGCSPLKVAFTNQSEGANSYEWDFGDGSEIENLSNPTHVFNRISESSKVETVTLTAFSSFGCKAVATEEIEVWPSADADFSADPRVGCNPLTVNIINNSTLADSYNWNFGVDEEEYDELVDEAITEFSYTYVNNESFPLDKTITLTAINSFGCIDQDTRNIRVNPRVTARISMDTLGCSPFNVIINNQSENADYYEWDLGDGTTSAEFSPSHIFEVDGSEDVYYTVRLIAYSYNGCSDTTETRVHVYPKVIPSFEVSTLSGCTPLEVDMENKSQNSISYEWNFDDGDTYESDNSEPIISHTFVNERTGIVTFSVRLTATNEVGCRNYTSRSIQVNPESKAGFVMDYDGNCGPLDVFFTNTAVGGSSYEWDFDDDSGVNVEFQPLHTFDNHTEVDKVFEITQVVTSFYGCSDTLTQDLLLHATPLTDFEANPQMQIWPDSKVAVTNKTEDFGWNYTWNFGDSKDNLIYDKDPSAYTYYAPGAYSIELTASSEYCSASVTEDIVIRPGTPVAAFDPDTVGCSPVNVQFRNLSQNAAQYTWDFGDGNYSTAENPEHTYYQEGVYTVKLTIRNEIGMEDEATQEIEVLPVPDAFFSVLPRRVTIPGQNVNFSNLSSNNDFNHWNFGDGTSSTELDPIKEYSRVGFYDVTLTITSAAGCRDTFLLASAVEAVSDGKVKVPNAFIPSTNGPSDGSFIPGESRNQIFYAIVPEGEIDDYHMQIFNRYGILIFESRDINVGWDGYYRNKLCAQDTYIWQVEIKLVDGNNLIQNGDVTLIR